MDLHIQQDKSNRNSYDAFSEKSKKKGESFDEEELYETGAHNPCGCYTAVSALLVANPKTDHDERKYVQTLEEVFSAFFQGQFKP